MPLHAQVQCFYAPQYKEAILGAGDGSAGILQECDIFCQLIVIADKRTHYHIGVTGHIFRKRMHDHIGAKINWRLQVRCCKGIINSQRSEEHTSELQSLMRSSYAVFCLKTKNNIT